MARRLSRKKISLWLLLIAVIAFLCNGGPRKVASLFDNGITIVRHKKAAPKKDLPIDASLAHRLDSFVEKTRYAGTLGIYVWDATAGKPVYAFNEDNLMRPASNMKMLTCITAIRRLGPNYRFESKAFVDGTMKADTLVGDIGLKFTTDPWFNSEYMQRLAASFAQKGIHNVKGRVLVDVAVKELMQHEEHWTPGDLRLRHVGMLYRGETRMLNEVKYMLRLQGLHFADSQVVLAPVRKDMKCIKTVSTPMRESIFRALQNSSNEHAECLGFTLAGRQADTKAYRSNATASVARFIQQELHLDPHKVCRLHDTSGLCVHNRVTPRLLVELLKYSLNHEYILRELKRALPISGQTGTLHDRMYRPLIRGKVQAKTGTLTREDGITSLSGFVTGKNGHQLLFAIIQNENPVYDARRWQDHFCEQFVK